MPGAFVVGIFLGAVLAILGVATFVLGGLSGNGVAEVSGLILVAAGVAFMVRNARAESDAEADEDATFGERRSPTGASVPRPPGGPVDGGTPAPRALVRCPNCGAFEAAAEAKFCRRCGRPIPQVTG